MSKAFTKEDAQEEAPPARRALDLPPGSPSYMTPAGARRLRDELDELVRVGRPQAVRATAAPPEGTSPEAARRALQAIDQRIAELSDHIAVIEVVDPATGDRDRVRFGATVTLAAGGDRAIAYRIVGIAEADPAHRVVSWRSPVARALLGAAIGDVVTLHTPGGDEELEIVAIDYEA